MSESNPLSLFLPQVAEWFGRALGEPTPVQREGWPCIVRGESTLLLAPTGSGKTLAAFLACLDALWRQPDPPRGVRILYVSPLKALNNDIHRNLQVPLAGIEQTAQTLGVALPHLEAAVRTGDTPAHERQRLLRKPPHILITTPESLHLLLTSRARDTLRHVTHCIVDEIHALCPNKRGVFLALLLERLQALNDKPIVRIGLSATQRPLEEVARYLGGLAIGPDGRYAPRPVTIVDAGLRKNLDLKVLSPVDQFGPLPERSVWPPIYRLLARAIESHRSTIVFANNRRSVERITAMVNEELGEAPCGELAEGELPVRAHHGSVSLEVRQQTEQALKEGRLRAVVATASLELGIDMGAVDLVCQVESPGSVARALQRVGRAGHLVGQESKGRLIPKTLPDLVNQAVLAAEMAAGRVEPLTVPRNCLDVLAQQIVAMVAMDEWRVEDLYRLLRQAYPYRDLTPQALESVLEMISGRFRFRPVAHDDAGPSRGAPASTMTALQPRISWDRVHHRLQALPGSQKLALLNGGTIPDTGQYAVVTGQGVRLGEVDEEFVYERRVNDVFLLGTSAWRIERIDVDRVHVLPAQGTPAMVPFWRGEQTGRSYDLGLAQGAFLRMLAERLDDPTCPSWLERDYFLDPAAARGVIDFVRRQQRRIGAVPTERTFCIEASRDPLGDWQVLLLTSLGSRFHLTLRLALEGVLRQRLGYRPQCLHHDDGVLIRLTDSAEPVLDLFTGLTADNLMSFILEQLADSPLFALRFRQNAARALLMPRGTAQRRAPLWLQRLRGRDLLQVARQHPDFPIVVETFRECLQDHLDVPRVEQTLRDLASGAITVHSSRLETPSPFAATLLFAFTMENMYIYNVVDADSGQTRAQLDRQLLDQLIGHSGQGLPLDPRAIQQVERRLRDVGQLPRTTAEMAEWLRRLGDLGERDVQGPMRGFLDELLADGRAKEIVLSGVAQPRRWILTEDAPVYAQAFGAGEGAAADRQLAAGRILQRFLETHALVSLPDILERYPFEPGWARRQLEDWASQGRLVVVQPAESEPLQWSAPANFEQLQRGTLSILRREVAACPAWQFADFVLRWQKLHPAARLHGSDGVTDVVTQLQAIPMPVELWEQTILPARVTDYQTRWLDELMSGGDWTWFGGGGEDKGAGAVAFVPRAALAQLAPSKAEEAAASSAADQVVQALQERGALFAADLAQLTGLTPAVVRTALWSVVRHGLVTNDLFDVARRGEQPLVDDMHLAARRRSRGGTRLMQPARVRPRLGGHPEGRWALVPWQRPDLETQAYVAARLLLQRYGFACRELALLDERLPPWRILYEVLNRLELTGAVRRGYFVEGLSGAQFALPDAVRQLQELAVPSHAEAPFVLVHSLDPANLYGAAAPLELGQEFPRPFVRRPGNWLVLRGGKPVLIVEQQGKRLSSMPEVARDDLAAAAACLPAILQNGQRRDLRHKLTVEEWNGQPVTATEGKDMLEAAGFVRDYQAMSLYAVWQ
ncbi:MAG: DEAD/DEAH box helicase [Gemmataceae bacterium]|nr:DEAD/DEAH box helicase [Gemmataceae bacterium]